MVDVLVAKAAHEELQGALSSTASARWPRWPRDGRFGRESGLGTRTALGGTTASKKHFEPSDKEWVPGPFLGTTLGTDLGAGRFQILF